MSDRPALRVDWCSHEAAKYAVEKWHYSRTMPVGKLAKFGAWEDGRFIGAILFGHGANCSIGEPYGLKQTECCELVRVALSSHRLSTSKILALALRVLRQRMPGLRLVVSYADSNEGHVGTIYQATNWTYEGASIERRHLVNGKLEHRRTLFARYPKASLGWIAANVDEKVRRVYMPPKHKYLYPLDSEMRAQIAPLAKPYPKKTCVAGATGSTSEYPSEDGGSIPTATLQESPSSLAMTGQGELAELAL
jgi:hypothetical protein